MYCSLLLAAIFNKAIFNNGRRTSSKLRCHTNESRLRSPVTRSLETAAQLNFYKLFAVVWINDCASSNDLPVPVHAVCFNVYVPRCIFVTTASALPDLRYVIYANNFRLSVTLVYCDHTVRSIAPIVDSLESPNRSLSSKVSADYTYERVSVQWK